MNANSELILYNNYNPKAPLDDKSHVCNHYARTGAFYSQVQAQVSCNPKDDAVVLLNGSYVDCYAHSRTNCLFGKALMVLQVLVLLTVSQPSHVLSVCVARRTSTVAVPLCRLSLAVCSTLLALQLPRSAPAQIVRDIQHLVRRRGDPVRPARTPSISEVLQYPSTSPTPVVRHVPRHRRVISDTTEEDINEEMGEAPD
jgi:hypothetical protein